MNNKTYIFATGNMNKVKEVNQLLSDIDIVLPQVFGITEEIPETGDTLTANALEKARYVFERTGKACFSEDTGLELSALDGAPGVYTARYAGDQKDPVDNMEKLISELSDHSDRSAQFRTIIALIESDGNEHLFEGICHGSIAAKRSGKKGFGYDPVFIPEGFDLTFAQLSQDVKNTLSHRAQAISKLLDFFRT